jgi:FkbM family methyltransferase
MMDQIKALVKKTPLKNVYWKLLDLRRMYQPFSLTSDEFYFKGSKEMVNGTYEPFLRELIVGNKENFGTLINIGANSGYYPCLAFANNFKNVIAVEPDKTNFKILQLNLRRNRFFQGTLLNAACSSSEGIGNLYGRNTGASLLEGWEGNVSSGGEVVKIMTLDYLFTLQNRTEKILTIIDVEGFEFEVLKGSLETLRTAENVYWVIEISLWRTINQKKVLTPFLNELFSLFQSEGYCIFGWEDQAWSMLSDGEIQNICRGAVFWPALPFLFKK